MSTGRHRWKPEATTAKWRRLERCEKCGLRRWLVQFENRSGAERRTHLHSRTYDGWSTGLPSCAAPPKEGTDT